MDGAQVDFLFLFSFALNCAVFFMHGPFAVQFIDTSSRLTVVNGEKNIKNDTQSFQSTNFKPGMFKPWINMKMFWFLVM